jgi:DNA-binding CsgD family transcriptional regulator
MQQERTTQPGEEEIDEAANLVDVLFGLVTERRRLSHDERLELKRRVSDRLREIVPYCEGQEGELDAHIDRLAAKVKEDRPIVNPKTYAIQTLSAFECDVLALMLQGRSDKEAAETLGIAPASVSKSALRVVHKLGAKNRVHAVARLFAAVVVEGVGRSTVEDSQASRYNEGDKTTRPDARLVVTEAPDLPLRPQAESGASA